jgi:hypothetical protein
MNKLNEWKPVIAKDELLAVIESKKTVCEECGSDQCDGIREYNQAIDEILKLLISKDK